MTKLPPGYDVRPGRPGDVEAIAAVQAAYDIADCGRLYADSAWLEEEWTKPRFDPMRDAWIVTSPIGDVMAYGLVYEENPGELIESMARVHPDHHGLGIGGFFVPRMEARARELLAKTPGAELRLLNDVSSTDGAAHELLEQAGYAVDRHFWHMSVDLTEPLPEIAAPPGLEIREFEPGPLTRPLYEVLQNAFTGHYGYSITPFDEWLALLETPAYVPGLWFAAFEGDEMTGALTGRELMGEGWVLEVGVLAPWRGRGIASALLARSFHAFRDRGLTTAALNVDAANETGATTLYEKVGMKKRRQWDIFLKVLRRDG